MTDTDNTELWRDALGVMGYDIRDDGLQHPIVFPDGSRPQICRFLDDEWGLFGLVVEWVEARGCSTEMVHMPGSSYYEFSARSYQGDGYGESEDASYLLAAARWVVEHGWRIGDKESKQ